MGKFEHIQEGMELVKQYIANKYKNNIIERNVDIDNLIIAIRQRMYGRKLEVPEKLVRDFEILCKAYDIAIGSTIMISNEQDRATYSNACEFLRNISRQQGLEKGTSTFRQNIRSTPVTSPVIPQVVPKLSNKQNSAETVVISDLHGDMKKWQSVKSMMNANPNMKIIILGDAMDRGDYGIEILLQIKELSDKERAEYLPGNHDIFAYNYLRGNAEGKKSTEMYRYAVRNMLGNGGEVTYEKLKQFDAVIDNELRAGRIQKKISKQELMNWLGKQPIQKKVKDVAVAHAMFDDSLYRADKGFNLEIAYNLEERGQKNTEAFRRFQNCMWYRENDANTHYAPLSWPKDCLVVVGHTRQSKSNLQYIGGDPYKAILYIDCGRNKLEGYNIDKCKSVDIEGARGTSR